MNVESRQFVDTNILVYAHDNSAGLRRERAIQLVDDLWGNGAGCLSLQVLQEFYVTITRKVVQPLSPAVAAQLVEDLGTWHVHVPAVRDVLDAIVIQQRYHVSFWDAMILHSAARLDCTVIWTEDLNAGEVYEGVQCVNPFT